MKLIKKGAEGDIYLTTWNNNKVILKTRKKKNYRNSILDSKIRKQRTIREAQIISEVKSFGISSPLIYFVDVKKCEIIMQYLDGVLIFFVAESKPENETSLPCTTYGSEI